MAGFDHRLWLWAHSVSRHNAALGAWRLRHGCQLCCPVSHLHEELFLLTLLFWLLQNRVTMRCWAVLAGHGEDSRGHLSTEAWAIHLRSSRVGSRMLHGHLGWSLLSAPGSMMLLSLVICDKDMGLPCLLG